MRIRLTFVLGACLLLLVVAAPAGAAPTGPVAIDVRWTWDGEAWRQTWRATGAVADGGRFDDRALSGTTVGEAQRTRYRTVLRSPRGTIVVRWYEWFTVDQDTLFAWMHGGWYAAWGTGAYAGVKGGGTFSDTGFIFGDEKRLVWRGSLAG